MPCYFVLKVNIQIITLLITVNDELQAAQSGHKIPQNNEMRIFFNIKYKNDCLENSIMLTWCSQNRYYNFLRDDKISVLGNIEMKFGRFGDPLHEACDIKTFKV